MPFLSRDWVTSAADDSVEYRLAAALAGIGCGEDDKVGPFRRHLEPIDPRTWNSRWPNWSDSADDPNLVWGGGGLVWNMIAVLNRRVIEAVRQGKLPGDEALLLLGADGQLVLAEVDLVFSDLDVPRPGEFSKERFWSTSHGTTSYLCNLLCNYRRQSP